MRDRHIFHIDMNAFYASVMQHLFPELRNRPIAVAGDPKKRNGIILAKSMQAKKAGVKTASATPSVLERSLHSSTTKTQNGL